MKGVATRQVTTVGVSSRRGRSDDQSKSRQERKKREQQVVEGKVESTAKSEKGKNKR